MDRFQVIVYEGSKLPLKEMEEPIAVANIKNDITIISGLYGIKNPEPNISVLMAQEIVRKYGHIGRSEIIEAFKMASEGYLPVSLELYGKPMNLWLIHQIMNAYNKERKRVKNELLMLAKKRREESRVSVECPEEYRSTFEPIKVQDPKQAAQEGKAKVEQLKKELNK